MRKHSTRAPVGQARRPRGAEAAPDQAGGDAGHRRDAFSSAHIVAKRERHRHRMRIDAVHQPV